MKHIRIIATLVFMAVLGSASVAQVISPVDFMRYNPRSVNANPAFYTTDYGYFDLMVGDVGDGFVGERFKTHK